MIVNLLGEFQILEEDKVIDEQKIKSERLIRLFVILIMNRTRVVTSTELVEALWFNEEIENPIGALKNLIYRLRMILSKTISEQNFILTRRGGYCWNPEIRIETDIDQFDDMILELRRDNRKEAEKCYYLEQAQTIYIGDFLKHHSDWNWILPINSYYHSQYLSIARQLAEIYLGERQFDKLEVFMKKALLIEPYEEQLHIYLIKALLYQNKKQLAIEYYEKSKKMLCDTLGITVLLEFERLQKELYSLDHNKQVMNLLEIRNTMEEEEVKGAFFCSFIVFQEMYRITARKNTRDHSAQSVILFQCNFRKEDKEQMNEKIIKYILKRSMEKLKNTALRLLRMGDLVSQFSENQLVILVLDCNYEDSILVANRILFQFQELLELKNMKITVEIEEVSGNEHTKLLNII